MNKIILAAAMLTLGNAASAGTAGTDPLRITVPVSITSLVINDGITVVLTTEQSREITVEGALPGQNPLKMDLYNGKLTLERKENTSGQQLVVYVPSLSLSSVAINGVSRLTSNASLPIRKLDVIISSECDIKIRTTGKVNIITWDDIQFNEGERPRN